MDWSRLELNAIDCHGHVSRVVDGKKLAASEAHGMRLAEIGIFRSFTVFRSHLMTRPLALFLVKGGATARSASRAANPSIRHAARSCFPWADHVSGLLFGRSLSLCHRQHTAPRPELPVSLRHVCSRNIADFSRTNSVPPNRIPLAPNVSLAWSIPEPDNRTSLMPPLRHKESNPADWRAGRSLHVQEMPAMTVPCWRQPLHYQRRSRAFGMFLNLACPTTHAVIKA